MEGMAHVPNASMRVIHYLYGGRYIRRNRHFTASRMHSDRTCPQERVPTFLSFPFSDRSTDFVEHPNRILVFSSHMSPPREELRAQSTYGSVPWLRRNNWRAHNRLSSRNGANYQEVAG